MIDGQVTKSGPSIKKRKEICMFITIRLQIIMI